MLEHMVHNIDIFACPECGGPLALTATKISCHDCLKEYGIDDGIPLLFCTHNPGGNEKDVTDVMRSFYEKTPFPDYDGFENIGDLVTRAKESIFARLLNEQAPFNKRILEVGCGTGQLSNFLGIAQRAVFGTDMCLNSLRLAERFRRENSLKRVGFYQMNLFRPAFKKETFSLVISNGVLHSTSDPFGGFRSIAALVQKGGYIIIGLYNRYGRIATDIRRGLFKVFGQGIRSMDPQLKRSDTGSRKKLSWFMDQYRNPHESKHTFGEVLRWFEASGFDFVNSVPKLRIFGEFTQTEKIFETSSAGSRLDRFLAQCSMMFTGAKEGGLFLMIGRKKGF
jgi:SAM-dependent methyltransferase